MPKLTVEIEGGNIFAALHGDYKLLVIGENYFLYNLRNDPQERRTVAQEYPEIFANSSARQCLTANNGYEPEANQTRPATVSRSQPIPAPPEGVKWIAPKLKKAEERFRKWIWKRHGIGTSVVR